MFFNFNRVLKTLLALTTNLELLFYSRVIQKKKKKAMKILVNYTIVKFDGNFMWENCLRIELDIFLKMNEREKNMLFIGIRIIDPRP